MKKVLLFLLFAFTSLFAFEDLTKENFDQKIANKNVIVDFHATWWGACKVLERNLTKFNTSNTNNITIYKVDIEEEPELTAKYRAFAIPMLVYLKDGKVMHKERGVKTVEHLQNNVKKFFK